MKNNFTRLTKATTFLFLMLLGSIGATAQITCDNFTYYLADHDAADGISDIYGITLAGDVATMTYIATSDIEVHIAFNQAENLIYAVSKHNNSYRTLDPFTGTWGTDVDLGADYGEITAAVFNADGRLLFGSQDQNAIYSVNVSTNIVSSYDTYSPVTGGDIAFSSDGTLYLATRSGNGLYQNWPDDVMPDVMIGNVPSLVTGMAITDMDELLVSAQGLTSLELYSTAGAALGSYTLDLDGDPYTLRDGDLASGCNTGSEEVGDCEDFSTFYVDHGPTISGSNLYGVTFTEAGMANMTLLTNVPYEAHIAFNAEANIVYLVNVDGSFVRLYNVATDVFIGDLILVDDYVKITAAFYNSDDGYLYIGEHHSDEIFSIDLTTGVRTFVANAPVSGGDIVMNDVGIMYLATRLNASLHDLAGGTPNLVGSIANNVTGMALSNHAPDLMLSHRDATVFTRVSAIDASVVGTYTAMLNGSPFTLGDGDMASGCADEEGTPPPGRPLGEGPQSALTAYPNPTTGQAQVVFRSAETGRTVVEVFDMAGRNVATLFNADTEKGAENRIDFDGTELPNGMYIYRMTTSGETVIEKFMIAR